MTAVFPTQELSPSDPDWFLRMDRFRVDSLSRAQLAMLLDRTPTDLNSEHPTMGGTLLTWAAEHHRDDLIGLLLERGADPLKASKVENMDALQWATATQGAEERRAATIALLSSNRGGRGGAVELLPSLKDHRPAEDLIDYFMGGIFLFLLSCPLVMPEAHRPRPQHVSGGAELNGESLAVQGAVYFLVLCPIFGVLSCTVWKGTTAGTWVLIIAIFLYAKAVFDTLCHPAMMKDLDTEALSKSELDALVAEVNEARVGVCVHVRCTHSFWEQYNYEVSDDDGGTRTVTDTRFVTEASFDQTDIFKYGECAVDPQNPSSVDMGGFGMCVVHLNVACDTDALTLGLNEAKEKAISDNRHRDQDCGAVHCCLLLSLWGVTLGVGSNKKWRRWIDGNDRESGKLFICSDAQKRRIQRMRPWVLVSICTGTIGLLYFWFVDFITGDVELNFKKVLLLPCGPSQNQQTQELSQEAASKVWKDVDKYGLNWDEAATTNASPSAPPPDENEDDSLLSRNRYDDEEEEEDGDDDDDAYDEDEEAGVNMGKLTVVTDRKGTPIESSADGAPAATEITETADRENPATKEIADSENGPMLFSPSSALIGPVFQLTEEGKVATKVGTEGCKSGGAWDANWTNNLVLRPAFSGGVKTISFTTPNSGCVGVVQVKKMPAGQPEEEPDPFQCYATSTTAGKDIGWFFTVHGGALCGNGMEDSNATGSCYNQVTTVKADLDSGAITFYIDGKRRGPGFPTGVKGPLCFAVNAANVGQRISIVPDPDLID